MVLVCELGLIARLAIGSPIAMLEFECEYVSSSNCCEAQNAFSRGEAIGKGLSHLAKNHTPSLVCFSPWRRTQSLTSLVSHQQAELEGVRCCRHLAQLLSRRDEFAAPAY